MKVLVANGASQDFMSTDGASLMAIAMHNERAMSILYPEG
jgi:hypothetical protein